jgi:8-hydroxy-5-deazaflavin:NADPH oxidoreductase
MPSGADRQTLALIGGTGPEGRGLALRLSQASYPVVLGSRSAERAEHAAQELAARVSGIAVRGMANADAARVADIVFLTVPYSGLGDAADAIEQHCEGKIVVCTIAPIEWKDGKPTALRPASGSAAQEVQARLARARVVSGFQTVDAHQLLDPDLTLDTDVLVCSDDQDARHVVMGIARNIPGVRPLSGGRLPNSRHVEEVTSLLVAVNRIYKVHSGIRITGVNR